MGGGAAGHFDGQITFRRVADLERAHEFYAGALGLPLVLDQGRCRIYRVHGEAFLGVCSAEPEQVAADSALVCLLVDDVDGCVTRLVERGAMLEQAPCHNAEFRIYHGFVRDPDGHLLELQRFDEPGWAAGASPSAAEVVLLVDEQDRPVGSAQRATMRAERLRHRATYVFVFGGDGRLLLQRRTTTKDLYPGYWDAAAGGVLVVDESYEQSARREAAEELGIEGVPLTACFDFAYEDATNRCFGRVFTCRCDGPFRLQPEEVVETRFVEVDEVLAGRHAPVTPDTLAALRRLVEAGMRPGSG